MPLPNPTPLFGGALTTILPSTYIDASTLRQIPDNQEVFLAPDSGTSLVISLLEAVTGATLDDQTPPTLPRTLPYPSTPGSAATNGTSTHQCSAAITQALHIHFTDSVLDASDRRGPNSDMPFMRAAVSLPPPPGCTTGASAIEAETALLIAAMRTSSGVRADARARGEDDVVFTGVLMGLIRLASVETDLLVEVSVPHVASSFDVQEVDLEKGEFGVKVEEGRRMLEQVVSAMRVVDWGLFGS